MREAALVDPQRGWAGAEDIALDGQELWGNYPQTYSLVGIINCANLLSRHWATIR